MKGIEFSEKEHGEMGAPILCMNNKNNVLESDHFVLSDCRFNGCIILRQKGTFVISDVAEEQIVKNSELLNISMKKGGKELEDVGHTQVKNCLIQKMKMEDIQDLLCRVIVSGLTRKT